MNAPTPEFAPLAARRKAPSAARVCFILLVACVPAAMLAVLLLPASARARLAAQWPAAYEFYKSIAPAFPSWLEYFAVQTLLAAIAVVGAWHLLSRRPRLSRRHLFAALVGAYALWSAISYFWSAWPYGTRAWVIRELPFWFLAVVAMLTCRTERRWLTMARVFLAAVLAQALVAAIVLPHVARVHRWTLTGAFLRTPLFFQNKNFSCAILLTGAYLTVALVLRHIVAGRRNRALVVAGGIVALGLLGFVFVVAGALAGWVALLVSAPAYALCVLPIRRKGLIAGAAAGVVCVGMLAVLVIGPLRERAEAWALDPENTANLRVIDWAAGARAFSRRPLAGWGVGTWPAIFPRFAPSLASLMPQTAGTRPTHPHNEFVRVATDLGAVGLLLYLGILAYAFGISYRTLRSKPLQTRLPGFALWAGALAFLVQTLFGKAPAGWCFSALYWILLGVLASTVWWDAETTPPAEERGSRMPAAGWPVMVLVLAAVLWGWWSWGVGAYRSTVKMRLAEEAHQWMAQHVDGAAARLPDLVENLELARPRSLHPSVMLYYDYLVGGTLVRLGRWEEGARYLEDHVDRWAPGMLKTDLMLAACYARLGRPGRAADRSRRYIVWNPYKLEGYLYLARFDPPGAASLLSEQLYEREGFGDAGKVMALLQLEATLGAWDKVQKLVRDASRANNLKPDGVVRMLADRLRQDGRQEALEGLEAAFPEVLSASTNQQGLPAGRP